MTNNSFTMMDVEAYLAEHISHAQDLSVSEKDFLARTKTLAGALGDPQEKCKVVHIAGTSGKGSTAFMVSALLHTSGQKVGLFTSPHLVSLRERFVIDGEMITEKMFLRYFHVIMDAMEDLRKRECDTPSYFEILTVLAYYIFAQERCLYAVMETGVGGRCDATNIVKRSDKIAVITPIGFDHMNFLGNTLEKIAGEKAGIIHKGNHVIVAPQDAIVRQVIKERVRQQDVNVNIVRKNDIVDICISEKGTTFHLKGADHQEKYKIGLIGAHQALNATVAKQVVEVLARRDQFDLCGITEALSEVQFPGRFEIKNIQEKTMILDGAHNPQKMTALVTAVIQLYPHEKCTVIFAAKGQKDFTAMLALLAPITEQLIITQFGDSEQDYQSHSIDVGILEKEAKKIGYTDLIIESSPKIALEKAQKKDNKKILVTGSLYLVGKVRELIE